MTRGTCLHQGRVSPLPREIHQRGGREGGDLVLKIENSTTLDQERDDLTVTTFTRHHQGRASILPREKEIHQRRERGEGGDLVLKIQSSTTLDQEGDDIMMALLTCLHQRCVSPLPREKDPSEERRQGEGPCFEDSEQHHSRSRRRRHISSILKEEDGGDPMVPR
jgi:hypothetical protein